MAFRCFDGDILERNLERQGKQYAIPKSWIESARMMCLPLSCRLSCYTCCFFSSQRQMEYRQHTQGVNVSSKGKSGRSDLGRGQYGDGQGRSMLNVCPVNACLVMICARHERHRTAQLSMVALTFIRIWLMNIIVQLLLDALATSLRRAWLSRRACKPTCSSMRRTSISQHLRTNKVDKATHAYTHSHTHTRKDKHARTYPWRAYLAFQFRLRHQGRHRVHHNKAHSTAACQLINDIHACLPTLWLAHQQVVHVDA